MRFIVSVLLVVFASACVTAPKTIDSQKIGQIQKVSAISLLGDRLNIVQIGTTIFNNTDKYESISGWDIDVFTVDQIRSEITAKTLFSFTEFEYEYSDFEDIYKSRTRNPYANYDITYIKDKLIEIRNRYAVDALILVTKARHDATGHNHYIDGCAVYSRSFLGVEVKAQFIFRAAIVIIDLNSLEVLSEFPAYGSRELQKGFWKENIAEYSDEELRLLERYTKEIIKSVIPLSFKKVGFANVGSKK